MSSADERRQFYRIRFPAKERPALRLGVNGEYLVTELSEGGLRIMGLNGPRGIVDGQLVFSDGRSQSVRGRVSRQCGQETIIAELSGVTFGDMMMEQRRLLAAYPFLCSTRPSY